MEGQPSGVRGLSEPPRNEVDYIILEKIKKLNKRKKGNKKNCKLRSN